AVGQLDDEDPQDNFNELGFFGDEEHNLWELHEAVMQGSFGLACGLCNQLTDEALQQRLDLGYAGQDRRFMRFIGRTLWEIIFIISVEHQRGSSYGARPLRGNDVYLGFFRQLLELRAVLMPAAVDLGELGHDTTLLHAMVELGYLDYLEATLHYRNVDLNARDAGGRLPEAGLSGAVGPEVAQWISATRQLLEAVETNDLGGVIEALDAGAFVYIALPDGDTVLHRAVELAGFRGESRIIRVLVEAGADFRRKNGAGKTALQTAVEKGLWRAMDAMVAAGVDFNQDFEGIEFRQDSESPKQRRARAYCWSRMQWLLQFMRGVRQGDVAAMQEAYENYGPAIVSIADGAGMRPVHWAAVGGHVEAMDFLMTRGADINVRVQPCDCRQFATQRVGYPDYNDYSPLMIVIRHRHQGLFSCMMESGQVEINGEGQALTPLSVALCMRHPNIPMACGLLEAGAQEAVLPYAMGPALVCYLVKQKKLALLRQVLAANPGLLNEATSYGITPLDQAVYDGYGPAVACLLRHGAVPTEALINTASEFAQQGDDAFISMLLLHYWERSGAPIGVPAGGRGLQPREEIEPGERADLGTRAAAFLRGAYGRLRDIWDVNAWGSGA
ncbi:MAG TPA: hypothetical protein PLV25_04440, partial [Opitutales bacterium]|nr:hypothetical protein [Opitutales bacterium]